MNTKLMTSAENREQLIIKLKITKHLENLPSKHLVDLICTKNQLECFLGYRINQKLISLAWIARFTEQDDPLKPLLKNKQIDRLRYCTILNKA